MKSKTDDLIMNTTQAKALAIRPSSISGAGRGVFARVGIAKGWQLEVAGFRVRRGSLADRCTHYADPYKFRVGKDLLIPSGYGALVNHSRRPNVKKVVARGNVYLETLRAIHAGEELFHAYSKSALKRFRRRPS